MDTARAPLAETYNPFISPQLEDPYPVYARARHEFPIFRSSVLGMWVVSRYEDILAIYRNPRQFSSADVLRPRHEPSAEALQVLRGAGYIRTPLTVDNDPPAHTRIRVTISDAFSPRRITLLEEKVRALTHELVDGFARDGQVELVERFAFPLPLRVLLELLGLPREDAGRIKRWSDDWAAFMWAPLEPEQQVACARSMAAYLRYCLEVVAQRKRSPGNDLLSALVHPPAGDTFRLSDMEAALMLNDLLFAGHETTVNALSNAVKLLVSHPETWEALRRNASLLPMAAEESLRLEPPVHCSVRTATSEAQVAGVSVPQGEQLCLLIASANRDESRFPNPDTLNLERGGQQRGLSFGHGIHYCVGASLARLSIRVALEVLGQRLPDLRLVPGQAFTYKPNLLLHAPSKLHLSWRTA